MMFILFGILIHLAFAQVTIRMEPLVPLPTEMEEQFAGYYLEPADATVTFLLSNSFIILKYFCILS